jgi:hypothetical protein
MVPTAYISLHLIDKAVCRVETTLGKPLVLSFETQYGRTDLTLFFRDEELSALLNEAVNSALDVREIEQLPMNKACPHEAKARAAGWVTDEEKHPNTGPYRGVVHPDGWWAPDWKAACERCLREAAAYKAESYAYKGSVR